MRAIKYLTIIFIAGYIDSVWSVTDTFQNGLNNYSGCTMAPVQSLNPNRNDWGIPQMEMYNYYCTS